MRDSARSTGDASSFAERVRQARFASHDLSLATALGTVGFRRWVLLEPWFVGASAVACILAVLAAIFLAGSDRDLGTNLTLVLCGVSGFLLLGLGYRLYSLPRWEIGLVRLGRPSILRLAKIVTFCVLPPFVFAWAGAIKSVSAVSLTIEEHRQLVSGLRALDSVQPFDFFEIDDSAWLKYARVNADDAVIDVPAAVQYRTMIGKAFEQAKADAEARYERAVALPRPSGGWMAAAVRALLDDIEVRAAFRLDLEVMLLAAAEPVLRGKSHVGGPIERFINPNLRSFFSPEIAARLFDRYAHAPAARTELAYVISRHPDILESIENAALAELNDELAAFEMQGSQNEYEALDPTLMTGLERGLAVKQLLAFSPPPAEAPEINLDSLDTILLSIEIQLGMMLYVIVLAVGYCLIFLLDGKLQVAWTLIGTLTIVVFALIQADRFPSSQLSPIQDTASLTTTDISSADAEIEIEDPSTERSLVFEIFDRVSDVLETGMILVAVSSLPLLWPALAFAPQRQDGVAPIVVASYGLACAVFLALFAVFRLDRLPGLDGVLICLMLFVLIFILLICLVTWIEIWLTRPR